MVNSPSLEPPSKEPRRALCLLSIREAVRRMGISKSAYYDQVKRPPLPGQPKLPERVKRGGGSGIPEHEVDDYIAALIHARDSKAGR